MVAHFDRLAERSRHDVRAFGRSADDTDPTGDVPPEIARERVVAGLARAHAALRFTSDTDSPLAVELRALCDSLEPALRRADIG